MNKIIFYILGGFFAQLALFFFFVEIGEVAPFSMELRFANVFFFLFALIGGITSYFVVYPLERGKISKIGIIVGSVIGPLLLVSTIIFLNSFFVFDLQNNDETYVSQLDNKKKAWMLFGIDFPFEITDEELNFLMSDDNTVVIRPTFTQTAYSSGGFYDYYRGECDSSCLTAPVDSSKKSYGFTDNKNALQLFNQLGWQIINDDVVHKNPTVLSNYDKVILLHNEYVTREMFDAITSHPYVIYLYPNALYAEVNYDEENETITLIRGHNYPEQNIANGFDWEFDNTHPYEFDIDCLSWEFYEIDNGFMLNCYPERLIIENPDLLKKIKEL